MAEKRKWIKGAIKHPGALHRELGVPQGEKIPEDKLASAAQSDNPTLRKRAQLAETLMGMHHGGEKKESRADRMYRKKTVKRG